MPLDNERRDLDPFKSAREMSDKDMFWGYVVVSLRRGCALRVALEIATGKFSEVDAGVIRQSIQEAEADWADLARKR